MFHAVRRYMAAAAAAGRSPAEAITGVTQQVLGVDVHPVAVTLARVTYLLPIGRDRLGASDRPAFAVPVYLGDSVQWGQNSNLLNSDALVVPTGDGATLFADELRFPHRVVQDAAVFDALVAELADAAAMPDRPPAVGVLNAAFRRHVVHPEDQPVLAATYQVLCELHDGGRDHIWGYYLRNLARPRWLARTDNRVDVLVGNPPWLSYRFMGAGMKAEFRAMSTERGFWAGAAVATQQDLSALFVSRAVEQYLRPGGAFAFVMPLAVLSRRQFAGFRTGRWAGGPGATGTCVTFQTPWDLHQVKPSFFPVPAAVVSGTRSESPTVLSPAAQTWSGRVSGRNPRLTEVSNHLTRTAPVAGTPRTSPVSPYAPRFPNGATLFPRLLVLVEAAPTGPLGTGAGRAAVRSRRSMTEKPPWKTLPGLTGSIEKQFLRPVFVGDTVLPFRVRTAPLGVIPWDGTTLLATTTTRLDQYPGLAEWWRSAEKTWDRHSSSGMTLLEQIDYRRKLASQLPGNQHRMVYTKSGMYLAAAYVTDHRAVIDHKLYWAAVSGPEEGRYLTAVLNSDALLQLVRPLQARGEHNPRDFDKYVWQLPIPLYDPDQQLHRDLVDLAERAAAGVDLPQQSFQALRRRVRQALEADGVAHDLNTAVITLLA